MFIGLVVDEDRYCCIVLGVAIGRHELSRRQFDRLYKMAQGYNTLCIMYYCGSLSIGNLLLGEAVAISFCEMKLGRGGWRAVWNQSCRALSLYWIAILL